MDNFDFINNTDPKVFDQLYQDFKSNPALVEEGWRNFFIGFDFAQKEYALKPSVSGDVSSDEFKVINLINDYRRSGHLFTLTNPVRKRREYSPNLDIKNYGLTTADLNKKFEAGNKIGLGAAKLSDIISFLNQTYCSAIGVEFLFIRDVKIVSWLKGKFESTRNTPKYDVGIKKYILRKLMRAVYFEKFLHKKFPGQKRFSLEGAEAVIPALDAVMEKGSELGIEEFIIGMPHRGRLNVLANILRKPYEDIFHEFAGVDYGDEAILGDVKYHLGYSVRRNSTTGKLVKMTLSPNPSHLEAVDPVVEGITRAKIDASYGGDKNKIVPILLHGDASIAGQGVVYEVLQMQDLKGYSTGGTIHLVINNQVGFTTGYLDARSSTYCTDVAKTTLSPVFHVNGDDPEALGFSVQLAMEFRNKFHKDVFIDILCYRKYGHNEGDEPRFTQPILYKEIAKHPDPYQIYKNKLLIEGVIDESWNLEEKQLNEKLEKNLLASKTHQKTTIDNFLANTWKDIRRATKEDFLKSPRTAITKEKLIHISEKITTLPNDLKFFNKTVRLQDQRKKMVVEKGHLDWAMGELLAYGSLLDEGVPVRLSGQDVERGTFSHRHSVLVVEDSEEKYIPLNNISPEQKKFEVFNSSLSEYGVLGFEYGYSLASPHTLTLWEAQFGDFANTAQVIFDQFLSSAEDKWNVMNDLVVLLPHGFEGQGPEHSSARIERYLTLCAENNMQLVNCTTPASFFHVLRRQLKREFRKPLIIFTPKSLLRHPKCVSPIESFTNGGFKEVLDDNLIVKNEIKRLAICSGKVYYDLLAEREKLNNTDVALLRIEQLYPFPKDQILELISKYKNVTSMMWVQEEPANMGPYDFFRKQFEDEDLKFQLIARPASGSPATGSHKFHTLRYQKIVDKVFSVCDCPFINDDCKMACIGNKWASFEKELEKYKMDQMSSDFHSGLKPLL